MAGEDWFTDSFRSEFERQSAALGRFNLAIFGKTGVGKSTLINAIFGSEVAATGIGEPVTQGSHIYLDKIGHLGIVDTQGLEVGQDDQQILADLTTAMKRMRRQAPAEQLHVTWYCVRGMDRRFEDTEDAFVRRLAELGLQVILVMTQVPMREGHFHPDALELAGRIAARRLPVLDGRPFLTYARPDPFTGQQSYGLEGLLDATFRCAPAGQQGALTVAQEIDQVRKAKAARGYIAVAASSAVAAAASPIPFSDAAMLVPIQLGMMAKLAQLYKIRFERAALMGIAATTAATQVGRVTFTGLIKLVPGAGTVVGGAISAGVASAYTLAIGQAWLVVCQRMAAGGFGRAGAVIDDAGVRELFLTEFTRRLGTVRRKP